MKTIEVDGQFVVAADDVLTFKDQPAFELVSGDPAEVINFGSVSVTSVGNMAGLKVDFPASAAFRNEAGASFTLAVTGDGGTQAVGFDMQADHTTFFNAGDISVSSGYSAIAVSGAHMDFENQGHIEVDGGLFASGVEILRDGSFVNSGTIEVVTGNANGYGVYVNGAQEGQIGFLNTGVIHVTAGDGSIAVIAQGSAGFDNSGSIIADPLSEGAVVEGLRLVSSSQFNAGPRVFNEGLIQGVYSIHEINIEPDAVSVIRNAGQLVGLVSLADNGDRLVNTGTITGDVDLGGGDDTYNGARGRVSGVVDGGDGDDTLVAGKGSDTLEGGAGRDLLTGANSADQLTGGGGADTFAFAGAKLFHSGHGGLITDLHDIDLIDLSGLDADATQGGDQAFVLVSALDGHAGQAVLSYDAGKDLTQLLLDIDGDGAADAVIDIAGDHTGFTHFEL